MAEGGKYLDGAYRSTFIGFVPWQQPRFLVYVRVDRPQNQYYGAQVAGPVVRDIIRVIVGDVDNRMEGRLRSALEPCDERRSGSIMRRSAPIEESAYDPRVIGGGPRSVSQNEGE